MKWRRYKKTNYDVSDCGKIRSRISGKLMKTKYNHDGYETLCLYINGKQHTFRVHRLVGECFIPNPLQKPQVHHMDGNKLNNHMSNLQWCDQRSNNYFSRHMLKHSRTYSFKQIELLYNQNKDVSLRQFINLLKK